MELIKKILFDFIVGIWFVIALFTTICLLSYNDFGVTTFGKQSLLIMDSDELEPDYPEGSLVVVKLGRILSALTSRWGFMFFILFPMLFAIIYEVMMIVDAAKKDKNEN